MSTISDIARKAGVSTGTVSKVLNNDETVKEKNRLKVLSAMEKMNYKPNLYARNLSKGKTGLISIIVPTIGHEFMARLVNAIDSVLEQYNYDSLLFPLLSKSRLKRFSDPFHFLYHTDGLIISSLSLKGLFGNANIPSEKPLVVVDTEEKEHDCIFMDNYHGGELAASNLYVRESGEIYIVGGYDSDQSFTSNVFRLRKKGFVNGINDLYAKELTLQEIPITLDWQKAYEVGERLAKENNHFSVFCLSDILAKGFIEGALQVGKLAGRDYSLIGYDDLEFSSQLGISTIKQPVEELGFKGAKRMIEMLQNNVKQDIIQEKILPTYVERNTNKPTSVKDG